MSEVNVNMKLTEPEKACEKLLLSQLDRKQAILKIVDIQGESRYFPLRQYWHEALTLGIIALKRVEEREEIADDICDNICRWREKALQENKDPDEAEKWLERNHCSADCPVVRMMT